MTAPSDATRYPRGAGPFPNPIPKHGENNPKPITVTDGPDTPSISFLDQKTRSPPSNSSRSLIVSRFVFSDALFIALIDGLPTAASRMP